MGLVFHKVASSITKGIHVLGLKQSYPLRWRGRFCGPQASESIRESLHSPKAVVVHRLSLRHRTPTRGTLWSGWLTQGGTHVRRLFEADRSGQKWDPPGGG